jgi:hypothetical protein
VSSDHAVEAELLGLRLSDVFAEESYAESMQIYTVNDLPGLLAQAATDPRMERVDDRDLQPISARRDETPLALLFAGVPLSPTRAAEEAADGAGAQDSHVIGLALFGKRTDRPAQMLVGAIQLPAVTRRLQEVLDTYPQIDPQPIESRVLGKQAKFLADFSAERLLGLKRADQDMAARKDCRHEVEYLLQNLPAYQTPLLGGHAFAEAAQLPQWQRRVEALLLDLESHFSQTLDIRPTIAELRQRLGLPSRGLINPKSVRLPELSLEQFSRLDFAQMPAKMLAWATNIALTYANINGLRSLLAEIERRIAAADPEILNLPLAKLYLFLGKIEGLPERGSACLLEAEKYFPEDLHERCDLLVRAIEVSAGRRLHEPLLRYFALLTDLAVRDDYCFAAYVKISGALGLELPDPVANVPTHAPRSGPQVLGRAVRSPAAISVAGAAETSADSGPAAPTGESKLWLPGM